MAMARTMATRMTMTRTCCLSGFSGTHLPVLRWEEGMSKPPILQDDHRPAYAHSASRPYYHGWDSYPFTSPSQKWQESLPSGDGILQDDHRPAFAHSIPPPYYHGWASYPFTSSSGGILQNDHRPAYAHSAAPPPFSYPSPFTSPSQKWQESQESLPSDGRILQDDHRPAYAPPPPPPPPSSYYGWAASPPRRPPPPPDPSLKYIDMGLMRPFGLPLEFSEGGIQDAHSDGTPAQRWWEVKYKKPWRMPPSGTSGILVDDRPPPPPPQLSVVGLNSNWEGRLKRWTLGHKFGRFPNCSLEDLVARRVSSIAEYFKVPDDPDDPNEIDILASEQFEYQLDEVQGYFEFMDLAHELHSIDCLFPLLHHVLVNSRAACIRAKTAELVTTMVHNNPMSQQLVLELHGLQPLWYNFTTDPDATSRTKALGAISALIWNNKPGFTAFREANGYAALGDALSSENVLFQREALNLIQYLLHENSSDCNTVTELGLPRMMMHLASSDDAEVRVAALGGLLVLARDEECTYPKKKDKGGNSDQQLVKNDDKLKQVLQELIKKIRAMAPEDLVAAREEIQLVDSLWNACYNEPSLLKLIAKSLDCCGSEAADRNSVSVKNEAPFLL